MTDDRTREREHWQAIAEQLGLSPEQNEEPAARSPGRPPPEPVREAEARPDDRQRPPEEARHDRYVPSKHAGGEPAESVQKPAVEQARPVEPALVREPEDQRGHPPKRGRGRRNKDGGGGERPRSRRSGREPVAEEGAEAVKTEPSSPRGRNRGRGGKGGRAEPAPAPEPVAEETLAPPEMSAVSEDADSEDLSNLTKNWNVPSWNELIASLYRPER